MPSYNDAVHGRQIQLSEVAAALYQHPALLQLRTKKQLAMTERLFTNATHTRYLHSVGTMIMAGRLAEALGLPEKEARLLEAAAALHDIGHYPFSHSMEHTRGTHHEEVPQIVLSGEDFGAVQARPLLETLRSLDIDPREVAAVLAGTHALSPLITNPVVDVDRLDYLARDFKACGVSFGADVDRLIRKLTFADGRVGVSVNGVVSLTSFLVARSLAYDQIYLHRRTQIAETMLQFAIRADPQFQEDDRETDERIHALSDDELLALLLQSENAFTRDLADRMHRGISAWYQPVLELSGEQDLDSALSLYAKREALEKELRDAGLLWSWNTVPKIAKQKERPAFPVSDGTDLFDRKLPRAAFDYVPERLLSIYSPEGSDAEKEIAQRLVQRHS